MIKWQHLVVSVFIFELLHLNLNQILGVILMECHARQNPELHVEVPLFNELLERFRNLECLIHNYFFTGFNILC